MTTETASLDNDPLLRLTADIISASDQKTITPAYPVSIEGAKRSKTSDRRSELSRQAGHGVRSGIDEPGPTA